MPSISLPKKIVFTSIIFGFFLLIIEGVLAALAAVGLVVFSKVIPFEIGRPERLGEPLVYPGDVNIILHRIKC